MNSVVGEARVALDARLLGQDIVVLTLKVVHNFLKANVQVQRLVKYHQGSTGIRISIVNIVSKPRGIHNGQGNTQAIFFQLCIQDKSNEYFEDSHNLCDLGLRPHKVC